MATCAKCSKSPTADKPLKTCAKCKSVSYCDRECQVSDWKRHKKDCSRLAGERASGPSKSTDAGGPHGSANANKGDGPHTKPFHAINSNTYLHDRPEQQTFELLVDCLRLRQEDIYKFEGDGIRGSIYDGQSTTSEGAFRNFIGKAKKTEGLLPPWLNDAKIEECIEWARKTDHGFSLAHAQEKADIQATWADSSMPMKLRMMGEKVYGNSPGGFSSKQMMEMNLAMENGTLGGNTSFFNMG